MATVWEKSAGLSAVDSFRDGKLHQTSAERAGAPVLRQRGPLYSRNKGDNRRCCPLNPVVGSLRAAGDCSLTRGATRPINDQADGVFAHRTAPLHCAWCKMSNYQPSCGSQMCLRHFTPEIIKIIFHEGILHIYIFNIVVNQVYRTVYVGVSVRFTALGRHLAVQLPHCLFLFIQFAAVDWKVDCGEKCHTRSRAHLPLVTFISSFIIFVIYFFIFFQHKIVKTAVEERALVWAAREVSNGVHKSPSSSSCQLSSLHSDLSSIQSPPAFEHLALCSIFQFFCLFF